MKWFFGKRETGKTEQKASNLTPRYEGDRGIHDLHLNDAELRLWLPVPLKLTLDECMLELKCEASEYLRRFLVVYLYGAHELLRMEAEKTGLYFEPPPVSSETRLSRASFTEYVPGLGKNIVPLKLRLPQKMKEDLQMLALAVDMPLGHFVRELLISHFLGHTVWPERMAGWTEAQAKLADSWAEGSVQTERIRPPTPDDFESQENPVKYL